MPLAAEPCEFTSPEYHALQRWAFDPAVFFQRQIPRMLAVDIPARHRDTGTRVWLHRDGGTAVGFGTLEPASVMYADQTGGRVHPYIPLLAVNPACQGKGFGKEIVAHLIREAEAALAVLPDAAPLLFLDVYTVNVPAIKLYEKFGFAILNAADPIPDPAENGEPYFVMARRLSPN